MCVTWNAKTRVSHIDKSCVTYRWVMYVCDMIYTKTLIPNSFLQASHSYVCHDSSIYVTWLIHVCDVECKDSEYDLSHICVTHMNESCCIPRQTGKRRLWAWHSHLSDVTLVKHIRIRVFLVCDMSTPQVCDMVSNSCVWHDSFISVTWLTYMCDMTHSCVWCDSFICVIWLIHMCAMTRSYVWYDSFICVPWLVHMCDMSHSCVWHDSFICVTCLIHVCDMTHSYVCHDSFTCVHLIIHMTIKLHSNVWRDACIRVTWPIHVRDMTHSCICGTTHSYACHDSFICVTWLFQRLKYWRISIKCVT